MSISLDIYNERKTRLQSYITLLSFYLQDINGEEDRKKIEKIKKQLDNDVFQLAVTGEFSRGKSTFINALIGRRLLPSSMKPTTAIRNNILYSQEPYITLHYKDQAKQPTHITEEEFRKTVAPSEPFPDDSFSEKEYEEAMAALFKIDYAEVGYPLSICREGVTILDTPGLNDLDSARSFITEELIPRMDAAVFLLAATHPLTESELVFLKERILENCIEKVFVVINFKDALGTEEAQQEIYHYIVSNLSGKVKASNIYLVSSAAELNRKRTEQGERLLNGLGEPIEIWEKEKTGFIQLEKDLANFFQHEQGAVKLSKPIKMIRRIIRGTINEVIHVELNGLEKNKEELRDKITAFQAHLLEIQMMGNSAIDTLKAELGRTDMNLQHWYEEKVTSIMNEGVQAARSSQGSGIEEMSMLADEAIAPLERQLNEEKRKLFKEKIEYAIEKSSRKLNDEWEAFERNFSKEFSNESYGISHSGTVGSEMSVREEFNIFDDLLEDLRDGWHWKTTSEKVLSGAGIALTVTAQTVVGIGKMIMNLFSGQPTEREKNFTKIQFKLAEMKKQKINLFGNEKSVIFESCISDYKESIDQQISRKNEQMKDLKRNTHLKDQELLDKKIELGRLKEKLIDLDRELIVLGDVINSDSGKVTL